jgi:hypothetical protein
MACANAAARGETVSAGRIWATLALCAIAGAASAQGAGHGPTVIGTEEVLFDWQSQRCEDWEIPDAPARAWRDGNGLMRLVAGSERNRAAVGPTPERMRPDCTELHEGARDPDPWRWGRADLAAAPPYPCPGQTGSRMGYFNPSNI